MEETTAQEIENEPTESIVETDGVENPVNTDTVETEETNTEENNESNKTEEFEKPWQKKKNTSVEKRIAKATYDKHESDRARKREADRADAAEKKLRELTEIKEPSPDDHETTEDYQDRRKEYDDQRVEEIKREAVADYTIKQEAQRQRDSREDVQEGYNRSREGAIKQYKDYENSEKEITGAVQYYENPSLMASIFESENKNAIVDYLGKNPTELNKIAQLSPTGAARQLGFIESKLVKAPAKRKTAPAPTSGAGGEVVGGNFQKKDADLSQAEYNAKYNSMKRGQ